MPLPGQKAVRRAQEVLDRERVAQEREIQRKRFGKKSKVRCNARMSSRLIKVHCGLDGAEEGVMQMAMTELNLSARAYDRILKVSRTIADLAANELVQAEYVAEAIQCQTLGCRDRLLLCYSPVRLLPCFKAAATSIRSALTCSRELNAPSHRHLV